MNKKRLTSMLMMLAVCASWAVAQVTLTLSPGERGHKISDTHYGIFFEEINHAGDGGLYAELIRNRSFEDNNSCEYWTTKGGATIARATDGLLNTAQKGHATVTLANGGAIVNSGFWGMHIVQGTVYKLSFFIKTSKSATLTAQLCDDTGKSIGETQISVESSSKWQKVSAEITATGSAERGQFALVNGGTKSVTFALDVVSLFPPTYKDRENGCRIDLAEKLEAMNPSFVRFPGGCFVEGQMHYGDTTRFKWKETIGAIETRPGHMNANWNYRVTDGLGFHEMLQLTEDLGAEPLFVVNVGLGHGWMIPLDQLQPYIQEALDAIEYANGDASTKYGAMRIAAGHPEPFNLRLIEIGNENYNGGNDIYDANGTSYQYPDRYIMFYDAIKAKYPNVVCIGDVEAWGTDYPTWRNEHPTDAVDEHYYRSPAWFASMYNKYDNYDRNEPKVYVGEYAVTQNFGTTGNLDAALGEAIYMLGMENNSDVCIMNSYAPIFVNENDQKWMPDMIRFNASISYGTPSYYVQQLMPNYVGKENIKWTESNNVRGGGENYAGLSTWLTAATFENYKVTMADGTVYKADFNGNSGWTNNGGDWSENAGVLMQASTTMEGKLYVTPQAFGDNYTIEVDATKTSGAEGFLIAFNYHDANNYAWWNLGGWGNSQHGVEVAKGGAKSTVAAVGGRLETGRTYHLKIEVKGSSVKCYMDGEQVHSFTLPIERKLYMSSNIDDETGKLYVKIVNYYGEAQTAKVQLKGYHATGGRLIQMANSSNMAENTTTNPYNVTPVELPLTSNGSNLTIEVPAYSFNIYELDVATGEVTDNSLPVAIDNGIYHLQVANAEGYLSRGGMWGTQATIEPFGKPIAVMSDDNGAYTLRYADYGNAYLGIDGDIYTDKNTSFPIRWQLMPVGDGTVRLYNLEQQVFIAKMADNSGCTVTSDASAALAFTLLSKEAYADLLDKVNPLRDITEGTMSVDMTDALQNASMATGIEGWEGRGYREGSTYAVTNRAGVNEVYENCGELKQTITGLTPGALYRFSIYAFYRGGVNTDCAALYDDGQLICNAYIYANDGIVPMIAWASQRTGDKNPDNMEEAAQCFADGRYLNTVVGRADAEGKLTVGLAQPQYMRYGWLIWGAAKLEQCTAAEDYTSLIQNPSFENGLNGWQNNGMQTQNNNEAKANKTGTFYCESWTQAPRALNDVSVQQTIIGLKDGIYRITAMCHAENQELTSQATEGAFLFAGENTTTVSKTGNYTVNGTAIGGELTIGFKTEGTNANWVTVDNFRLEWIGIAQTGYKKSLEIWIGKLQTLIDTKNILSDELKKEAVDVIAEAQKAETDDEMLTAITALKAKYDELDAYRIPVDRSDEIGKYKGYLFTFFPSNNDENLYYAYSDDGFNYTVLNNGQKVMASDTVAIKKGIRDPHILRGADGKTFYMVATDMRSAEGWASNRGIVLYKSTDMIHWQHSTVHFPTRFPDGWSSVTRVWAPEVIWDANYQNADGTKGRYLVYFSLLTSDDGTCTYDKVYYCYANDDFTDLLDYPQHFYDRGSATIDADIVYDETDRLYHMIYKNEGSGGIMHVTAETLTPAPGQPSGSQWSAPTGSVQQTNVAVEGGGIFRLIGENTWVVMYDCYGSGYYQFCTTTDWKKFTLKAQTATSGAFTPRHGTVIPITVSEYNALIKAFPAAGLEPAPETPPTAIAPIPNGGGDDMVIYDLNGVQRDSLQKGLNIVRNLDTAETQKIVVK